MDIQLRFLKKAIEDKNFISFTCNTKKYDKVKVNKLENDEILHTDKGVFKYSDIKKIIVLKDRF